MRLPRFEYIKPATVEESLAVLEKSGQNARLLAGGTDLLVTMKYGIIRPAVVIGIKAIPGLDRIAFDSDHNTTIGACATLTDLSANSQLAEKFPALSLAVKAVASQHLRNMATIGGNICLDTRCYYYDQSKLWRDARELCHKTGGKVCHAIKGADRCHAINNADTAPALIALDAKVVAVKKGNERLIPVKDFYQDNGRQYAVLEPQEMLTTIMIPENQGNTRSTFIKISMRRGLDFAMGSIAASVRSKGKGFDAVRLILGSMTSAPVVLEKAAQVIMESGLTETSIAEAARLASSELGILTNLFTSAGYKRQLAPVLVSRALTQLKKKKK